MNQPRAPTTQSAHPGHALDACAGGGAMGHHDFCKVGTTWAAPLSLLATLAQLPCEKRTAVMDDPPRSCDDPGRPRLHTPSLE